MNQNRQSIRTQLKNKQGFHRIFSAFSYSLDGLHSAWKNEAAFRQELIVCLSAAILALFLPVTLLEKLILIVVLVWVLIIELLNSAIEAVVDRVSLDRHPLSKNAKDFGSAAVLLVCAAAIGTWLVILYPLISPRIFHFFG